MDTIQVIFGNLLLLLAELAAIALAIIVLLLQANLILWLAERLARGPKCGDLDGRPSRTSHTDRSYVAGVPERKEG